MYKCGWNGCEKAYGTLNHLNAHVTMQSHGSKRTPEGKSFKMFHQVLQSIFFSTLSSFFLSDAFGSTFEPQQELALVWVPALKTA